MAKIKEFIKKNHLIAYLITMSLLVIIGYCVKWYHHPQIAAALGNRAADFYGYFNVAFIVLLLGASVMFFAIVKKLAIEKLYLTGSIFTGILFMFIVTPLASADETNHIYKCYDFSSCLMGKDMPDEKYHWLRECDAQTELDTTISAKNYLYMVDTFWERPDNTDMVLTHIDDLTYDNDAVIYYFPAVIGITIGRLCNLSTVAVYTLGRIFMLAAYIALTYIALKKMPAFKTAFALVMMMPSTIARAASISQDGMLMAYTFVFMAYAVYYIRNKEIIRIKDAVAMVLTGIFMTVGKGGAYIPFLLLLFLIPKENFGTRIKYGVIVGASIALSFGAYCLWNLSLFTDIAGSAGGTENDLAWTEEGGYTIKYILTNPVRSLKVFVNSFFTFSGTRYVEMIGSGYGWLQTYTSEIWVVIYTILLAFTTFTTSPKVSESETLLVTDEYCFDKKQRIMSGIIIVFSSLLVIISMWIFWTPLSSDNVLGVQGRYFIPVVALVLMMMKNRFIQVKKDITQYLVAGAVIVHIGTFFNIWTKMII